MADLRSLPDEELTDLLKSGDHAAFTTIYHRYWPLLYAHARKMLRDDQEAMDIVQELFTTLWTKAPELALNTSLKAYLYAAVRNFTLNQIRRGKLRDQYVASLAGYLEKGEFVTDEQVICADFMRRIEQEVSGLPPKVRAIFEMSRHQGLSHKQIAQEMDMTDNAVKKSINRTLKVLRAQISSVFFFLF